MPIGNHLPLRPLGSHTPREPRASCESPVVAIVGVAHVPARMSCCCHISSLGSCPWLVLGASHREPWCVITIGVHTEGEYNRLTHNRYASIGHT